MRMVARSLSVSFNRSRRAGSAGSSSSLIASISEGESEKNATSDEDIKPERMRSKPLTASAIHAERAISGLMIWLNVSKRDLISVHLRACARHRIGLSASQLLMRAGSRS